MDLSVVSIGVPVNAIYVALGSDSLRYFAYPYLISPVFVSNFPSILYWVRWASSTITTIFSLSLNNPVSSTNFWIVENITPPVFLPSSISRTSALLSHFIGSCLKNSYAEQKVSYNWPSKSFLSVITNIVGLFNLLCFTKLPAKKVIEKLLPLPCVCQITPALPSFSTALTTEFIAFFIP